MYTPRALPSAIGASRLADAGVPGQRAVSLESISTDSLTTKADRAYHALLLTQARDKNYITQTDDSLICSAIAYYNQTDNTDLQIRSYYYCGCVTEI